MDPKHSIPDLDLLFKAHLFMGADIQVDCIYEMYVL